MNKRTTLIIGVLVVVIAVVGGFLLQKDDKGVDNPTPTPTVAASPSASPSSAPTPAPVSHTIRRTDSSLTPQTLTIRVGDTVVFVNDGTSGFWPASDPHPTHTLCAGFDARRPLKQGESYSLEFTEARTCTYHNHLAPSQTGTITIR